MYPQVVKINPCTKLPIIHLSENCTVTPMSNRRTICALCDEIRLPRKSNYGIFCRKCKSRIKMIRYHRSVGHTIHCE